MTAKVPPKLRSSTRCALTNLKSSCRLLSRSCPSCLSTSYLCQGSCVHRRPTLWAAFPQNASRLCNERVLGMQRRFCPSPTGAAYPQPRKQAPILLPLFAAGAWPCLSSFLQQSFSPSITSIENSTPQIFSQRLPKNCYSIAILIAS